LNYRHILTHILSYATQVGLIRIGQAIKLSDNPTLWQQLFTLPVYGFRSPSNHFC